MPYWLEIVINIVFSYIASVGFALTINIPHRVLNTTGICGTIGWMVYWFASQGNFGRMISNLLGAFMVGIFALIFAKIKKCPVTVFNIPALVPLVPGVPAYQAVRFLVNGNTNGALDSILRVGVVTSAIALGILLSVLVIEVYFKIKKRILHLQAK